MMTAIIAHRGASALATHENTLEAFQIAINLQADFAEFDIRRTKDHQLIAFHNPDLNGTDIRQLTYDEICRITGTHGYRVPLLQEVLELCRGKIKLDIELKETGYEQKIIDLVERYYDYSDYMMKSFIDRSVLRIKEIDPNIKAGLLIGTPRNTIIHRLNEYFPLHRLHVCKADFISPHFPVRDTGISPAHASASQRSLCMDGQRYCKNEQTDPQRCRWYHHRPTGFWITGTHGF